MRFLAELQRRNVLRAAVLYAGAVWLLAQIITQLGPVFSAPVWIARVFLIAAAIGFPFWLVFAWVYEWTPQGLKRESEVVAGASITRSTGRKLDRAIIIVLAISVVLLLTDRFVGYRPDRKLIDSNSIAVLPLANVGGTADDRYFSDGLTESLITSLSQLEGVRVISSNSSFRLRDSKASPTEIGAQLAVALLLEGSMRRLGGEVSVNLELVDTNDGTTRWSQRYVRPYKDLFKLQDELSLTVARACHARVLGGGNASRDRPPGGSLEAYDAYLQAEFAESTGDEGGYRKAIALLGTAIRIDPKYAQAHASRAMGWLNLARKFLAGDEARAAYANAQLDATTALSLDSTLANAHVARGLLLSSANFDWEGAAREYRRAAELAPNDGGIKDSLAGMEATLGNVVKAVAYMREEVRSDPLCAHCRSQLAMLLAGLGDLEEARQTMRQAIDLEPDHADRHTFLAVIEILRGDAPAALAAARQEVAEGGWQDIALALASQVGADRAAADTALAHLIETQPKDAAFQIAEVYALRRDADNTFKWLDRAWDNRDPGIDALLYDPFILRFRADPRFVAFAQKVGLPTTTDAVAMP